LSKPRNTYLNLVSSQNNIENHIYRFTTILIICLLLFLLEDTTILLKIGTKTII